MNEQHTYGEKSGDESADRFDLNTVRHPEVTVQLGGSDGNAFAIIGAVQRALRRAGVSKEEVDTFFDEATSGDYDHLLETCMDWVNIE